MDRFNESFEKILKDMYAIEWVNIDSKHVQARDGFYKKKTYCRGCCKGWIYEELSRQEILGIIVIELLERNGDICIEGKYRVVSGKTDKIGDTEIQALQETVNSIDWSK